MDISSTMMGHQPLLFYPYYNNDDHHHHIGSYGHSSSRVSVDDVSDDVSSSFPASTALADGDHQPMNLMAVDDISDWLVSESSLLEQQNCLEDEAASQHLSPISSEEASKNFHSRLFIPAAAAGSDKEESADANLSIFHLLKAYGEAMEMDALDLAAEIARKLRDKSSPTGSTIERLACYLIQPPDQQFESLVEEAVFNSAAAFKAFYQIFPYGRFAHFCANSVILNAVRDDDAELVHIVDFDIGTGVQWPPVIEALARRGRRALKLTAIKWEGERNLEQTRENLLEYARASGLRLQIGEMEMEEALRSETAWKADKREWLAFNCMVGLPHMGKVRSEARSVIDFLKLAKESTRGRSGGRASITFGDGIGWGRGVMGGGYGSVFEGMLVQFRALLETMDCHFLEQMREARIAMECLLLMPYFVSATDMRMWEDIAKEGKALSELGLEACEMQEASIMEAKELVREGEGSSSYWATNEGAMNNQMVLGYMGTPLVKVSSWR